MSGKELPVTDTLSKLHCIFDNWCVVEYRKYVWIVSPFACKQLSRLRRNYIMSILAGIFTG